MRFGLLGSLEVLDDRGEPVDVGGSQSRTVLAVLLAAAGRAVTADTLVDALWGDEPPASATGTLQSYVSRLRRSLEPSRERGEGARLLVWEPPGYRLAAGADDVDFRRFERLADAGRDALAGGRVEEARDLLVEADRLWRGPALVEYRDHEFAVGLAARLEDRRLAAVEDRVAADLALGRHAVVAGELRELVGAHPLKEGLRAQHALALYRAGRQAEALRALAEARRVLRDELGVEPGRALRELEAAILAHDPALDAPPAVHRTRAAPPGAGAEGHHDAGEEDGGADRMVGREAELADLVAALDEAASATRAVVVEGEPGIGKTRLVEELAARAARRGALVLWGRTFEGSAAPALWPWLPPLRALVATLPGGTRPPAELAGLLSATVPAAEGPSSAVPAHFALAEAVAGLLTAVAGGGPGGGRPVVLVLDDLQWADVDSLELLTSLLGRLGDQPVLIVVTVRELEVGRNDAVVDVLAALARRPGSRRLHLRGLSTDASRALVAHVAGERVGEEDAAAIHRRAEGNPFFTTELARLVAAGQGLPVADVPSGVRDVVRRRLAALPPSTGELLQVAAVVGREFDLTLLSRASERDLDACLLDLEPATVHRLVVPAPDQPGSFRFAHALVREALVDDLSALRRARLHQRVADHLDDTEDHAAVRAEHLWQAVPLGSVGRAAAALERAAEVAVRRLAHSSAEDLLERAVQLRRSAGTSVADREAELHAVARLVAVVSARRGYPALVGSALVARGRQLAAEVGRPVEELNLRWAEWAALSLSSRVDEAAAVADELVDQAARAPGPLSAVIANSAYGMSRWHRGRFAEAAAHLDAAHAAVAGIGPDVRDAVLFDFEHLRLPAAFAVYVHDLVGDLDDPEARYDGVIRQGEGDRFWELAVCAFAVSSALAVGDLARSERAGRRGMAADPHGVSAFWSMTVRAFLGGVVALRGDLDEGLALFDEAWASYAAQGLRTNGVALLATRGHALAQGGRCDEAAASLEEARRLLESTGERWAEPALLLAEAALALERGAGPEAAAALLRQGHRLATDGGGHGIARRLVGEAARLGLTL